MFPSHDICGASVRYYNSTIGWGENPSQLTVGLAEDVLDGDVFSPPLPGAPLIFQHGNFTFGGILQHQELQRGEDGAPVYEVSLYDPRIILDAVQLILDGYYGSVYNSPNIMNVYGYLENNIGFGGSEANDTGMPWRNILSALGEINIGLGGIYGNPIMFRGYQYSLLIQPLPNLPDYYRVGGTNISLLSFIQDICEAGGMGLYRDWETS